MGCFLSYIKVNKLGDVRYPAYMQILVALLTVKY